MSKADVQILPNESLNKKQILTNLFKAMKVQRDYLFEQMNSLIKHNKDHFVNASKKLQQQDTTIRQLNLQHQQSNKKIHQQLKKKTSLQSEYKVTKSETLTLRNDIAKLIQNSFNDYQLIYLERNNQLMDKMKAKIQENLDGTSSHEIYPSSEQFENQKAF